MDGIFGSPKRMEVFCANLVDDWVEYRQNHGLSFTEEEFMKWMDEFYECLGNAYYDTF